MARTFWTVLPAGLRLIAAALLLAGAATADAKFRIRGAGDPWLPSMDAATYMTELRANDHRVTNALAREAMYAFPSDPDGAMEKVRRAAAMARRGRLLWSGFPGPGTDGNWQVSIETNRMISADVLGSYSQTFDLLITLDVGLALQRPEMTDTLRDEAFRAVQDLAVSNASLLLRQQAASRGHGEGPGVVLVREQQDRLRAYELEDKNARDPAVAAALLDAQKRLLAFYTDYFVDLLPRPLSLDQVRAALQPDEAILIAVPDGVNIFLFGVSKTGFALGHAEGLAPTHALLTQLRCDLDEPNCGEDTPSHAQTGFEQRGYPHYDLAAANEAYELLVKPVEQGFGGATKLFIVATNYLSEVPFAALTTAPPRAGADFADPAVLRDAPWLGNRYAMTMMPSVEALSYPHVRAQLDAGLRFVGYGAPVLAGAPDEPARGAARRIRRGADAPVSEVADADLIRSMPSLPGTRRELERMASLFGAGESALHLGAAATEPAVRADPALSHARVITFATHGLLAGDIFDGSEPALVLTPPAISSPVDDGLLTASEVVRLRLDADWVVLSACNTATNVTTSSRDADSLSSLARSFLSAGARALLASHWRVSDDTTAILTVETLAARDRGLARGIALQQAERAVRGGVRADGSHIEGWQDYWAHPTYWAPFTVFANNGD